MMTFKELKKLVKLPLYKEQRVPTVKALEESGVSVVAEKILENHGSISVYQNGYVIYRAHKRVTVFSLRNCVHYKYDALEGAGHHIEEEEFDEYEWHIRLVLEGEDRIFMNYEIIQGKWMPSREDREYREEILEGVDEAVSTLERMISEERVEELLSTLTDNSRYNAAECRKMLRRKNVLLFIAVRRSWDVWSGIPVHLQVFWQMSAIVVMYWQERPLHRTF